MVGFRLTPCPSCHEHVLAEERECPHCGAPLRTTGAPLAAVIAGLVLTAGCPAEALYGLPATSGPDPTSETEADTEATTTASTGGASGDATAEGTGSSTDSTTSEPEPEYGVPTTSLGTDGTTGTTGTTSGPEPDYGVPTTSG